MPLGNPVEKNAAMRAFGVTLIEHGDDFQAGREFAISLSRKRNALMVPSFHPYLIRGVATYWWEFFKAVPNMDVVSVPIGMGSGAASAIAAKLALGRNVKIAGVVSSHSTAYADSIAARRVVASATTTVLADGMACRIPDQATLDVLIPHIDHIVKVTDAEVAQAMRDIYQDTHNVAEGAGAASFAAAMQERTAFRAKVVGTTLCGGNVDASVFARVLASK